MNLQVDIQTATTAPAPDEEDIRRWVAAALRNRPEDAEITVRIVDRDEMITLNEAYRGKSGSTNVLSFPAELPEEVKLPLLGDVVICAPEVLKEAAEQNKAPDAHWAHLTVHGTLHLLGYDHLDDAEASAMEALETAVLASLDYPCPYTDNSAMERAPQ